MVYISLNYKKKDKSNLSLWMFKTKSKRKVEWAKEFFRAQTKNIQKQDGARRRGLIGKMLWAYAERGKAHGSHNICFFLGFDDYCFIWV